MAELVLLVASQPTSAKAWQHAGHAVHKGFSVGYGLGLWFGVAVEHEQMRTRRILDAGLGTSNRPRRTREFLGHHKLEHRPRGAADRDAVHEGLLG